jgi:hypothetical protein
MKSYENCPEGISLVSVAILESIFEMELLVVSLDENEIPWKVIEHASSVFILNNISGSLGHSTLYVQDGKEKMALDLLKKQRIEQTQGKECKHCGLWLGPNVILCPACKNDQQIQTLPKHEDILNNVLNELKVLNAKLELVSAKIPKMEKDILEITNKINGDNNE